MRPRAVIIGSGALGLGFVAERLAPDYDLCLADVRAQEARLLRLQHEGSYTINLCGLGRVETRQVQGNLSVAFTDRPAEDERLCRALEQADLVLTATSRRLLDQIVPWLSEVLAGRKTRHYLLFCENGLSIARSFAGRFGRHTVLVDTVMSRMCRFDVSEPGVYAPVWPGGAESLVAEDYAFWPLDANICQGGPFSAAFSLVPPEQFVLWEDVKLYLHNGMHAFVAYQAFLEGARSFTEVSPQLREAARETMLAEVVPAIVSTHPCARRAELEAYGLGLLARFFNPFFADSIARGLRGIQDKLAPEERLISGCKYIQRAGISPDRYSRTIAAAEAILAQSSGD